MEQMTYRKTKIWEWSAGTGRWEQLCYWTEVPGRLITVREALREAREHRHQAVFVEDMPHAIAAKEV